MDIRKQTTRDNYSRISQMYADDFGRDRQHFELIDEVLAKLKRSQLTTKTIVDLGAGPGQVTDHLVERKYPAITAVDMVPEFCRMIQNRYEDKNTVRVICSDMVEYVKHQNVGSIAAYIANYSLIHVPDQELHHLFQDVHRSLSPGGVLLMSGYVGTFKGMEAEPYQTQADPRLKTTEKLETYMNYFTEEELRQRLTQAGMKVLKVETFTPYSQLRKSNASLIWILAQK